MIPARNADWGVRPRFRPRPKTRWKLWAALAVFGAAIAIALSLKLSRSDGVPDRLREPSAPRQVERGPEYRSDQVRMKLPAKGHVRDASEDLRDR